MGRTTNRGLTTVSSAQRVPAAAHRLFRPTCGVGRFRKTLLPTRHRRRAAGVLLTATGRKPEPLQDPPAGALARARRHAKPAPSGCRLLVPLQGVTVASPRAVPRSVPAVPAAVTGTSSCTRTLNGCRGPDPAAPAAFFRGSPHGRPRLCCSVVCGLLGAVRAWRRAARLGRSVRFLRLPGVCRWAQLSFPGRGVGRGPGRRGRWRRSAALPASTLLRAGLRCAAPGPSALRSHALRRLSAGRRGAALPAPSLRAACLLALWRCAPRGVRPRPPGRAPPPWPGNPLWPGKLVEKSGETTLHCVMHLWYSCLVGRRWQLACERVCQLNGPVSHSVVTECAAIRGGCGGEVG
ncbi:hypothetical protein QFZ82_007691 [Streptomyces sp. V4I23]|nr:hypothetical protein [Streptomyces sp. V4I23]